ncbi:MAG: response regulator transcription factor, partial [Bacteroidota bacterium]
FISSLSDAETFERVKSVLPIAFLNKPVSKVKLQRTIELIVNQIANLKIRPLDHATNVPSHISIKNQQQIERIPLADIVYIEVLDKQCKIERIDSTLNVRTRLKDLLQNLPTILFIQTHRSYLVNLQHVKNVNLADQNILMSNQAIIPLSRSYREYVLDKLNVV